MSTLRLGETVVELVKAKLQAELATRIATINAEATLQAYAHGGFQLATPGTDDFYTSGLPQLPAGRQAVIVAEGPGSFGKEGSHSLEFQPEILVAVIDEDPDRQRLGKKLQRLSRAVIEALWDGTPQEQLDGQAYRIVPYRTMPGPIEDVNNDESLWRSTRIVSFRVTQLEN
jgi:hypothetical protein